MRRVLYNEWYVRHCFPAGYLLTRKAKAAPCEGVSEGNAEIISASSNLPAAYRKAS